jgi:hypothetical protein
MNDDEILHLVTHGILTIFSENASRAKSVLYLGHHFIGTLVTH